MWFAELLESINNQAAWLFTLAYTQRLAEFPVVAAIVYVDPLSSVGPISLVSIRRSCCLGAFGCLPAKGPSSFLSNQLTSWLHIFQQVCPMQYHWGLSQERNLSGLSAPLCTWLLVCPWPRITFSWVLPGWLVFRHFQTPWWSWCLSTFRSSQS